MRADIQRFGMDALMAQAPECPSGGMEATFHVQRPRLRTVPVHWHDFYELGYVIEGSGSHVVNGVADVLRPGSAFLLSPADFHEIRSPAGQGLLCLNVVLSPMLVEQLLASLGSPGEIPPWVADLSDAGDDIHRICEDWQRRRPGWQVVVEARLRILVVELARRSVPRQSPGGALSGSVSPAVAAGRTASAGVRRALVFLEAHFREPVTLSQVARVANLSPQWFSEQFRLATGNTFQAYLKQRRLRFAKALLQSSDLSVTEICHAAGFNDPSYFGRSYRGEFGEAPSRHRRHLDPVKRQRPAPW